MQSIEIEVKFQVRDPERLEARLGGLGFRCRTPRTFERNILFDTPAHGLRNQRQILRLRRYGDEWLLTHKRTLPDEPADARHKQRIETETKVEDGHALATILDTLGYTFRFVYEKWRSEWQDGTGHCVIDETPIGRYAELEGPPEWIDGMLAALEVQPDEVTTLSYGRLFDAWKQQTGSSAANMSFEEIEPAPSR